MNVPQYYLPTPPKDLLDWLIARDIEAQNFQIEYFTKRTVAGAVVVPAVYQPTFEPEIGHLAAIFHEPGAVHLVFNDEVAPNRIWDERWRAERQKLYGRTKDVESVEIKDGQALFKMAGAWPGNPYEFASHATNASPYTGSIFSSTWDHCMGTGADSAVTLRGGYQLMDAPVYDGGRTDAENWAKE